VRITDMLGAPLRLRASASGEQRALACSVAMWRRQAFARFGGFDSRDPVDDLGWFGRALAAGCRLALVDSTLAIKRIRAESQTRDPAIAAGMLLRLARARAAENRARG
jgi:hypothetical protein